jgi:hypothetical protein
MVPVNNSDTAWLVVADYNQDNDLPYENLIDDIANPDVNDWCYLFPYYYKSGIVFPSGELSYAAFGVGGGTSLSVKIGGDFNLGEVGTFREEELLRNRCPHLQVGGNNHDPHQ